MTNEIKSWIISLEYNQCRESFGAYAKENPLDNDKIPADFIEQAEEDLWDDYGWTVTGMNCENIEIDPDEDPDAFDDAYNELYYDFKSDISWSCEEDEYGEIQGLEIIYDERENA